MMIHAFVTTSYWTVLLAIFTLIAFLSASSDHRTQQSIIRGVIAPYLVLLSLFTLRYVLSVRVVAQWQYQLNTSDIQDAIRCANTYLVAISGRCADEGFLIGSWLRTPSWFYVHIFAAIVTTMAQLLQFLRPKKGDLAHRRLGYAAAMSLFVSAGGAIAIMFHSEGGLASVVPLSVLSILWIHFMLRGIHEARRNNQNRHRENMWRVLALTFSAPMLRLYERLFRGVGASNVVSYIAAQWAALVGNIIVVECLLRFGGEKPLLSAENICA